MDVVAAFYNYRRYLSEQAPRFPPNALALATADWYFDFNDHRSPHDAWLEEVTFSESGSGDREELRTTSLRIRLLGAYHDKVLEFFYPKVFGYKLDAPDAGPGLGDWRYDEFRISETGSLIHEIEWAGFPNSSGAPRWNIEASDVEFRVWDRP